MPFGHVLLDSIWTPNCKGREQATFVQPPLIWSWWENRNQLKWWNVVAEDQEINHLSLQLEFLSCHKPEEMCFYELTQCNIQVTFVVNIQLSGCGNRNMMIQALHWFLRSWEIFSDEQLILQHLRATKVLGFLWTCLQNIWDLIMACVIKPLERLAVTSVSVDSESRFLNTKDGRQLAIPQELWQWWPNWCPSSHDFYLPGWQGK